MAREMDLERVENIARHAQQGQVGLDRAGVDLWIAPREPAQDFVLGNLAREELSHS